MKITVCIISYFGLVPVVSWHLMNRWMVQTWRFALVKFLTQKTQILDLICYVVIYKVTKQKLIGLSLSP